MELAGAVALVTGGSSGIGAATAISLARQGADIAISGLAADAPLGDEVSRCVKAAGRRCHGITADLADSREAPRTVAEAVAALGRLDVLVHCAGGPAAGGLFEVSDEEWYDAFDLHVHAIFHLCRAAVPHMRGNGAGAIVLISSAAGARGCLGALAYGVVKGAIPQFTRSLARELAASNIRVNCVSPGIIRTRFQNGLTPEQVRNNIENRIPLRREGTPEDVAKLIMLLVTNDFITGENIAIDGGMTMHIA